MRHMKSTAESWHTSLFVTCREIFDDGEHSRVSFLFGMVANPARTKRAPHALSLPGS